MNVGRANTEAENRIFSCTARPKECYNIFINDLALTSSINRLDSSSGWKWWHQSYVNPFQGGRLQFRQIIKLEALSCCSLSVVSIGFSRERTATVLSLVTMTPPNQQRPFRSREMLNRYSKIVGSEHEMYPIKSQHSGVIRSGFSQSYNNSNYWQ